MPRLIITKTASHGLERCRKFLAEKSSHAVLRAGQKIEDTFALLEVGPEIGRPFKDVPELREIIVPFGDAGYTALYRHEVSTDSIYILAFRHQKEAGY